MIINNLFRKLFTKGKSSFFGQNINNLKKTSLSKNPVVVNKWFNSLCVARGHFSIWGFLRSSDKKGLGKAKDLDFWQKMSKVRKSEEDI